MAEDKASDAARTAHPPALADPCLNAPCDPGPEEVYKNPAKWTYLRIVRSIIAFEKTLDSEHEVGARLVSFGGGDSFNIEDMGYWGPDLIIFIGRTKAGQPVQLIQHVSQVSVLLTALRPARPTDKPRRIGFMLAEKAESPNHRADKLFEPLVERI